MLELLHTGLGKLGPHCRPAAKYDLQTAKGSPTSDGAVNSGTDKGRATAVRKVGSGWRREPNLDQEVGAKVVNE